MTAAGADRFSRKLWTLNQAQYDAMVAMPFNVSLADGNRTIDASVSRMVGLTDALAEAATDDTRRRMTLAFTRCTTFEWMFWDSAYRDARWPSF